MNKSTIGYIFKLYRKLNNYTVEDIAKILKKEYDKDVATKTIYGWENGAASPTSDMFVIICEIYDIRDISIFRNEYLLDSFDPNVGVPRLKKIVDNQSADHFKLSKFEKELITKYREQSEDIKKAVHVLLNAKYDE